MKLDKGKYKKAEVEKIIEELKLGYEGKISEQNAVIAELGESNVKLKNDLEVYKSKEESINKALLLAREKAEEIEKLARTKFEAEQERLKLFYLKWNTYFTYLDETYPNYAVTVKTREIREKLLKLFEGDKKAFDGLESAVRNEVAVTKAPFNPKAKIEEYIKSENGFDMNEVLYPDESKLDLEELCKELGLME